MKPAASEWQPFPPGRHRGVACMACARATEFPERDGFVTRRLADGEWRVYCGPCRAKSDEQAARRLGRRAAEG